MKAAGKTTNQSCNHSSKKLVCFETDCSKKQGFKNLKMWKMETNVSQFDLRTFNLKQLRLNLLHPGAASPVWGAHGLEWSSALRLHQFGPERAAVGRHPQVRLPGPGDAAGLLGQGSARETGPEGQRAVVLGRPPRAGLLQHERGRAHPLPLRAQHRLPALGHHRHLRHHSGGHAARYVVYFLCDLLMNRAEQGLSHARMRSERSVLHNRLVMSL